MRRPLELKVDPRRTRLIFLGLLAGSLVLIWAAGAVSLYFIKSNDRAHLEARIQSDALILEEHASRTLDTVAARLDTLATITDPQALTDGRLSSNALRDLILDDRILRSISLLDDSGRVLASSSPENVGVSVEASVLSEGAGLSSAGGIRYSVVTMGRDLSEPRPAPQRPVSAWLAAKSLTLANRSYRLVAVVNLSLFENLWTRVDQDEFTELTLMDLSGRRLVTHHGFLKEDASLRPALSKAVTTQASGSFFFDPQNRYPVAFRVSPRHPVVMLVVGDLDMLAKDHRSDIRSFAAAALLASLLVAALLVWMYRAYHRYELTVVEMSNQARVIAAHMLVSESTPGGIITSVNDNYCVTCGYEAAELVGKNHRIFNSGIHPPGYYRMLWETVLAGKVWKGSFRNRHKDGSHFWLMATIIPFVDAWGKVERFVAIYTDITESMTLTREVSVERRRREQLAQVNQDLLKAAHTDPLTGVANRRGFDSFASHLPEEGGRGPVAVLMLDLDHFKSVNDTYGHAAGDEVLKVMAHRWAQHIRVSDLLARIGGEEFCVLLPGIYLEGAQGVAEKIRQATCNTPVMVTEGNGRRPLPVTVSIGLAWAGPSSDATLQALLDLADEALYESKHGGRNRVSARVG
jgi:diguanylate cyclase (GGDEF)-like protein/PAS domain S-box-containing protein